MESKDLLQEIVNSLSVPKGEECLAIIEAHEILKEALDSEFRKGFQKGINHDKQMRSLKNEISDEFPIEALNPPSSNNRKKK